MTVQEGTRVREQTHFGRPGDFMTVRHLAIRGTNFEIGQALGALAIERYGRTPADFAADPTYARARRVSIQRQHPIHWERMKGVAAAFGLDPEDDRFDLTGLPFLVDLPMPPSGCSVVYYPPATSATGGGYLSRNYDFSIESLPGMFRIPLPPEVLAQFRPVMSEPYVMEWYPEDGGYASLAIHAFDILAGTLDGINSAGLAVSILADNEATSELGPTIEVHPGPQRAVGVHELAVMRLLLDTCATVAEAEEALLTVKQYYRFVPCHYIVADRTGRSFIYENSTGRNVQHVIEGTGQPQFLTNFQLYKHPTLESMPNGKLTVENEAFWRYRQLAERVEGRPSGVTADEMKATNACVSIRTVIDTMSADPLQRDQAVGVPNRTVWHSLYDQEAARAEISFYLGDEMLADDTVRERRSEYLSFVLSEA